MEPDVSIANDAQITCRGANTAEAGALREAFSYPCFPANWHNNHGWHVATVLRSSIAVVLFAVAAENSVCRDWRRIRPTIESEVIPISLADGERLLSAFCEDRLHFDPGIGLTCSARKSLGQSFTDLTYNAFHPKGVIYGHFVTPQSEDAAVSGWSAEGHPALWGGTLLLTKRNGAWHPVWYKSSAITRSCRKLPTRTGREILLCEEEDAGMGAQVHYLYSLDLTKPVDLRDALLVTAQSFDDGCTVHKQVIQHVAWIPEGRRLAVTLATPEWRYISAAECAGNWRRKKRPASVSIIDFELANSRFRRLQHRE